MASVIYQENTASILQNPGRGGPCSKRLQGSVIKKAAGGRLRIR